MNRRLVALPALLLVATFAVAEPPTSKPAAPWSSWRLRRGANPALQAVLDAQGEIRAQRSTLVAARISARERDIRREQTEPTTQPEGRAEKADRIRALRQEIAALNAEVAKLRRSPDLAFDEFDGPDRLRVGQAVPLRAMATVIRVIDRKRAIVELRFDAEPNGPRAEVCLGDIDAAGWQPGRRLPSIDYALVRGEYPPASTTRPAAPTDPRVPEVIAFRLSDFERDR